VANILDLGNISAAGLDPTYLHKNKSVSCKLRVNSCWWNF